MNSKSWFLAMLVALVAGYLFRQYVLEIYSVDGISMTPTLMGEDRLLVEKITYRVNEPKRGDICVFEYPRNPDRNFVKRIIGLPGDTVEVTEKGLVIVNGQDLTESYVFDHAKVGFSKTTVPQNSFFVLGDNRNQSEDSRYSDVGFVPYENIVGRALYVIYPTNHVRSMDTKPTDNIKAIQKGI